MPPTTRANAPIRPPARGSNTDPAANQEPGTRGVSDEEAGRRRSGARANDDADASHEGGMGAQGGAVDFGNPKNIGGAQS